MSAKKYPHHGSTLDAFLEKEGLTEEVNAIVQKRLLANQLRKAMKQLSLSEAALAKRMQTSRTVVRNLLDPANDSATLLTLARAASAVGRRLYVGLEPSKSSSRAVVTGSKAAESETVYRVKTRKSRSSS